MSDDAIDIDDLTSDPAVLQGMVRMLWKQLKMTERRLAVLEAARSCPPQAPAQGDDNQGFLFDELRAAEADASVDDNAASTSDDPPPPPSGGGKPSSRRRGKRAPIPPELPRVIERHERSEDDPERKCSCCGDVMAEVGVRKTEQLDYIPASLIARQHQQVIYGCKSKCDANLARATKPAQPIERGLPGAGLLAQVVVSRFDDHIPYYRLSEIFARQQVAVSRASLSRWMASTADLAEPIVQHMEDVLKRSRRIHTDDTTYPILESGLGKTRAAKIWTYVGDEQHPHTVYKVTLHRTRDGPKEVLADYEGALQADAYSGYDCVYANGRVVEVACWAHAKRKFDTAFATDLRAGEFLALIKQMYDVERDARKRKLGEDEHCALRQKKITPILKSIRERCDHHAATVRPKSPLAVAIGYVNNQWDALNRFASTGHLQPDNNIAERSLRGLAIGRRNWLFGGSFEAAQRSAVLLSLIESCNRNQVDAFEYLRDVLLRISTHPHSRIAELTPAGWKAAAAATATDTSVA